MCFLMRLRVRILLNSLMPIKAQAVEVLKEIASDIGKAVPSVAIRWILDYLKNSVVIVGVKTPEQVMQNVQALGWNLTEDQVKRLEQVSKE